jgi:transcriptional regulator with XRE-family HTH domain
MEDITPRTFGEQLRQIRLGKRENDPAFSLRKVAAAVGVEPGYLSKVERDVERPSDDLIVKLAAILGEEPDVMLGFAGRISEDVRRIIAARPMVFARIVRELKEIDKMPDDAILRVVRVVRDGEW